MKNVRPLLLLFAISLCLSSCDSENPGLVNKWKLVATLFDPGDGSGKFRPVDSGETIEFYEDGTLETNAFGCLLAPDGRTFEGIYSLEESQLTITDCQYSYSFELSGEYLIVNLQCIEPCRLKFKVKV